jgi:acetyl-CoA carboxylase biotin carboxylase subunit
LLVHRPDRASAVACLRRALAEFVVEGIATTIPLHRRLFEHPAVVEGRFDTTFLERDFLPRSGKVG